MTSKEDKIILCHLYSFDHFINEFYHKPSSNNEIIVKSSVREIAAAYFHHCKKSKVIMGTDGLMSPEYLVYKLLRNQCYPCWGYVTNIKNPAMFDGSAMYVEGFTLKKSPL